MHTVVESLRNSFVLLYTHVHQSIMRTVVFDSHDDETDVSAFWHILGVDADALPSAAFANPWFFINQPHVNFEARFIENPMNTVTWVVFKCRKFVDTRFCSTGVSMRAVLASLCPS